MPPDDPGVDGSVNVVGHSWQNPVIPADVSGEGEVTPLDALLIVNYLNAHGTGSLPSVTGSPPPYVDVNGDGACSARDVLAVVNLINERTSSTMPGSMTSPRTPGAAWICLGVPAPQYPRAYIRKSTAEQEERMVQWVRKNVGSIQHPNDSWPRHSSRHSRHDFRIREIRAN